jgi:hypothetical protein
MPHVWLRKFFQFQMFFGPIVVDVFNFSFPFFLIIFLKEKHLAREQEKKTKKGLNSKQKTTPESTKHAMGES